MSTLRYMRRSDSKREFIAYKPNTSFSKSNKSPVNNITQLQRVIGNQAVQRLFKSGALQAKMTMSKPGDKYEQEADRVADQVVRIPKPDIGRQIGPEEEDEIQTKPIFSEITPSMRKQTEEDDGEELVQKKGTWNQKQILTPDIESSTQLTRDGGWSLTGSTRAFTADQDIFFRQEVYNSNRLSEYKLRAHELTNVVQQIGVHRHNSNLVDTIQCVEDSDQKKNRRRWAANYIHDYWYVSANDVIDNLPFEGSILSPLLIQTGTLIWSLSPFLNVSGAVLAIIGTIGAQIALLGTLSEAKQTSKKDIREEIKNQLDKVEFKLLNEKVRTSNFDSILQTNYNIYNNEDLAIWHTVFPNIGFENRIQLKQYIKASALQTISRQAGDEGTEKALTNRETTIAAIGKAIIELEHWKLSKSDPELSNIEIVEHFNETYRMVKKSFDPGAGTQQPIYGIGHGAFKVLKIDSSGEIRVSSGYRLFFNEAANIQKYTYDY